MRVLRQYELISAVMWIENTTVARSVIIPILSQIPICMIPVSTKPSFFMNSERWLDKVVGRWLVS